MFMICLVAWNRNLSNPFIEFVQPPSCYFTSYKELLCHFFIVRKSMNYVIVWPNSCASVGPISEVNSSTILFCRLYEFKKYDFRVDSDGTTSMPNFIQIRPAVLVMSRADKQLYMCSFHAHSERMHNTPCWLLGMKLQYFF
jgi:hypothetical protein